MGKKTTTETRTKAAVGRERRLALALRALLDATDEATFTSDGSGDDSPQETVFADARQQSSTLLEEFGYGDLESIPKRVARLNESLKQAVEAGDGKLIAQLGDALSRAQAGLPPKKAKAKVKAASE